jgi:3-oxoacyl-[acyl-carrier-protein] synthase II
MSERRVVITGRGVVSPLGIGIDAHWEGLIAGRSAIRPIPRLLELDLPSTQGGEISSESLLPHLAKLPKKQQKLYNRATLLACVASALAVEEADFDLRDTDPALCGVFLGTNVTSWDFSGLLLPYLEAVESEETPGIMDLAKANAYCLKAINPLDYSIKTLPNLSAGHLAIAHNARGFCRALAEGSIGGIQAMGQAYWAIREGEIDVAICGGTDAPLEELLFASSWGMGFLAPDDGDGIACRPFSRDRRGTVLGEGSGILILEADDHARRRGARVLGELRTVSVVAGDGRQTAKADPPSLAERLSLAISQALDGAGASRPDLIVAHGDGTVVGDQAEAEAIIRLFGEGGAGTPVTAFKPAHGHLLAGAGPVEFLSCLAGLEHGIIPPVAATGEIDLQRHLNLVRGVPRTGENLRLGLVNVIGDLGECASAVVALAEDK